METTRHNRAVYGRPDAGAQGIALLEVLLAVSLLGVGVGVLLWSISQSTRLQSHIEDYLLAQRLAEMKLLEFRTGAASTEGQALGGRFDPPDEEYTWSARIAEAGGDEPYRLIVLSIWKGQERLVFTLETLLN